MRPSPHTAWLVALVLLLLPAAGLAQDEASDLATQLQNPVADPISVPLQNNFDFGVGRDDGFRYTLNVQPVVPISISRDAQTPAPSKTSPWSFEVTPYLWAAGIHGDFSARGRSATVDPSFSDLLENLGFGLTLFSELRYDRWGLLLDGQYLKLSSDADTPGPAFSKVDVTSQTGILAPSLAYRPLWTRHFTLDVLAGIRAWWVDTELELKPGQLPGVTVDQSKSWVDPIVGLRLGVNFADGWFLRVLGDVGGFGAGSDLTWQAFAGVGYQFHRHWSMTAGYRALAVDFQRSGFEVDVIMHGPVGGVGFRF